MRERSGSIPATARRQGISPRWTGFDPTGRGQRQDTNAAYAEWVRENKGEINRLGAEVKATEPGTREHEAATRALERLVREGSQQTGQAAVDERIDTVPDATPEERAGAHAAQDSNRRRIE